VGRIFIIQAPKELGKGCFKDLFQGNNYSVIGDFGWSFGWVIGLEGPDKLRWFTWGTGLDGGLEGWWWKGLLIGR